MKLWKTNYLDGFTDNAQYTYKSSSATPNSSIQFGNNDLVVDVSSICAFLKVDNQLVKVDPSANKFTTDSDYTTTPSKLKIYNMYNSIAGLSGSSDSVYKAMDASFESLFDVNKLKTLRPQDISAQWQEVNAIQTDDALYNSVIFFVMQSGNMGRQCPATAELGLSDYFLRSIIQNKSNGNALQSLKYAYYAIIKPRFLANLISNMYLQNAQTLTNEDKGSNDSIVFVLNTISDLANNSTLVADLSYNSAASIVGAKNSPIPNNDTLRMYQTIGIAYELCRFVNASNTKIQTTLSTLAAGYPQYMEKANQSAPLSPLLFLLKNPPDASDCASASNLINHLSNTNF